MTDSPDPARGWRADLARFADGHMPAGTGRGRLLAVLGGGLAVLMLGELLVHKHPYFDWAGIPFLYILGGLAAGVALVLLARAWRAVLGREETYGDD